MTLATFHADVALELNKGTSLNAVIPGKVRQAARWLERNYSFDYMKTFQSFPLIIGDTAIALPARFKSMIFLRMTFAGDVDFTYLEKVDPTLVSQLSTTVNPTAYWIDGNQSIRFDGTMQEALTAQIYFNQFTSWPSSPYATTPALLDIAEDVLLLKTMEYMGPYIRNPELQLQYKDLLKDALVNLTGSQMEGEQGGASPIMEYK